MKKIKMIITAMLATAFFSACNSDDTAAKVDATNFSNYVDSVHKLTPAYTESEWRMIDAGYQANNTKVEKHIANFDAAVKARIEEDRKRYEVLKADYENHLKEMHDAAETAEKTRIGIRNELLGPGNPRANNDWGFVTAANVVSVYKNFVDKAKLKGDNYSNAEWVETEALWKSLNDRKEAINKDISTIDKITIDHLRVAYIAVEAVHRPISQVRADVKANK